MSPPARSRPEQPAADAAPAPFWRTKTLATMTVEEWESLCDGCGRCCLVKLEDEDTGAIAYTDVACRLFDAGSCRCSDYPNRSDIVADCVRLTPEAVESIGWLPPTCAYRAPRKTSPNRPFRDSLRMSRRRGHRWGSRGSSIWMSGIVGCRRRATRW